MRFNRPYPQNPFAELDAAFETVFFEELMLNIRDATLYLQLLNPCSMLIENKELTKEYLDGLAEKVDRVKRQLSVEE
jgi:hypothetical protein